MNVFRWRLLKPPTGPEEPQAVITHCNGNFGGHKWSISEDGELTNEMTKSRLLMGKFDLGLGLQGYRTKIENRMRPVKHAHCSFRKV